MGYYDEIYLKRLNRYGTDLQSRQQGQRERKFEDYLAKSVYRIDFEYDESTYPGTLEPYKQDESETQAYLLTRVSLELPNGTILMLPNKDVVEKPWMVWWLESMKASGYNRYVLLRMTHEISWISESGAECTQWAYFYGKGSFAVEDTVKSKTGQALYAENNNLHMFITSTNKEIKKDGYFKVTTAEIEQAFRITEIDVISTPGVEYVSVDPSYIRDETAPPAQSSADAAEDFFWLNGGNANAGT